MLLELSYKKLDKVHSSPRLEAVVPLLIFIVIYRSNSKPTMNE